MNFANMPELNWHAGYYLILIVMGLLGLGCLRGLRSRAGLINVM